MSDVRLHSCFRVLADLMQSSVFLQGSFADSLAALFDCAATMLDCQRMALWEQDGQTLVCITTRGGAVERPDTVPSVATVHANHFIVPIHLDRRVVACATFERPLGDDAWPEVDRLAAIQVAALAGLLLNRRRSGLVAAQPGLQSTEQPASQLQTLADSFPGGFTYVDAGEVIRMVNAVSQSWLGIRKEQIVGKTVLEFTGPDRYHELKPHIDKAMSGQYASFDRTLVYPVAGKKDIHTVYVPDMAADGTVRGYFSLITDLNELRKTERALRHAQKMEAVGQLSSGIAHDFNNLLMVIHGSIEMSLLELDRKSALYVNLDRAQHAVERGIELTRRLLGFSRKNQLGMEQVNLNHIITNLKSFFSQSLTSHIEFNLFLSEDLWPVHANTGDLEDSILNLIVNARDAMDDNGRITLATYNTTRGGHDYVVFCIKDTGHGIDERVKDRIFEPFYSTKSKDRGTGLGLSLVYGFVKRSGGEIEVESKLNQGTTFRLLLPRADSTSMGASLPGVNNLLLPQGRETVLLVDDEIDLLATVRVMLERLGYLILEAGSPQAALAILQRGVKVDLLFSDIVLGDEANGYQLLQQARTLQPGLKVLLTTGFDQVQEEAGGTQDAGNGNNYHILRKPYRLEDLALRVRRVLDS